MEKMGFAPSEIQNLAAFTLPPGWRGRSGVVVLIWQVVQATLFAVSPQPLYGWRRALLRLFGAKIGRGVLVRPTVRITYPWKVKIDDHAWIGDDVELYSLGPIVIGANAVISQRTYICTGSHDYRAVDFSIFARPITIGASAWLATDVFVAPGVTIGMGTVVSARSSVFADLPPLVIARGTPARVTGPRLPVERPASEGRNIGG